MLLCIALMHARIGRIWSSGGHHWPWMILFTRSHRTVLRRNFIQMRHRIVHIMLHHDCPWHKPHTTMRAAEAKPTSIELCINALSVKRRLLVVVVDGCVPIEYHVWSATAIERKTNQLLHRYKWPSRPCGNQMWCIPHTHTQRTAHTSDWMLSPMPLQLAGAHPVHVLSHTQSNGVFPSPNPNMIAH